MFEKPVVRSDEGFATFPPSCPPHYLFMNGRTFLNCSQISKAYCTLRVIWLIYIQGPHPLRQRQVQALQLKLPAQLRFWVQILAQWAQPWLLWHSCSAERDFYKVIALRGVMF